MASRDPKHLNKTLYDLFQAFHAAAANRKIDFMVTCTWRSPKEQAALYAQGRTKPGKVVTWVKTSNHSAVDAKGQPAARAFDVVVMVNGKPEWSGNHKNWSALGRIGKELGLVWGGDWRKRDLSHFELPSGEG